MDDRTRSKAEYRHHGRASTKRTDDYRFIYRLDGPCYDTIRPVAWPLALFFDILLYTQRFAFVDRSRKHDVGHPLAAARRFMLSIAALDCHEAAVKNSRHVNRRVTPARWHHNRRRQILTLRNRQLVHRSDWQPGPVRDLEPSGTQ